MRFSGHAKLLSFLVALLVLGSVSPVEAQGNRKLREARERLRKEQERRLKEAKEKAAKKENQRRPRTGTARGRTDPRRDPRGRTPVVRGRGRSGVQSSRNRNRRRHVDERRRSDRKKEDRYLVVQVGYQARIVKRSKLDELRREVARRYRSEKSSWEREKKAARERGDEFTRPAPKVLFTVLTSSGFSSEKAARTFRTRAQAKLDAAKRRAAG